MIQCPHCGNNISDRASNCPYCGASFRQSAPSPSEDTVYSFGGGSKYPMSNPAPGGSNNKWLYAIIAFLVLALIGLGIWAWQSGVLGGKEDVREKDTIFVEKESSTTKVVASEESEAPAPKPKPFTPYGTHNFRGVLSGSIGIEMSFKIEGSTVNGHYHYNSQKRGADMILYGSYDHKGNVYLQEYAPSGLNTGRFDLYLSPSGLSGSFYNYNTGKTFKVNLPLVTSLSKLSTDDGRYDYWSY